MRAFWKDGIKIGFPAASPITACHKGADVVLMHHPRKQKETKASPFPKIKDIILTHCVLGMPSEEKT